MHTRWDILHITTRILYGMGETDDNPPVARLTQSTIPADIPVPTYQTLDQVLADGWEPYAEGETRPTHSCRYQRYAFKRRHEPETTAVAV